MNLADEGLRLLAASRMAQQQEGHAHFWERALSSLRRLDWPAARS